MNLIGIRKNIIHLSKKTLKTLCRLFYSYYICICEDISTL
ncbi:hypothetical protein HMPREF6745_1833 [Prevotella sp. oral taxon 472 str. F0295]|nr:hypothetical protein HMPREF6745_1833 [Prevotella sp. oral taxon 472 str. F0295]